MEQFSIDNKVDLFHQARKIAYSSPAFRRLVKFMFYLFVTQLQLIFEGGIQKYVPMAYSLAGRHT